MNGIQCWNHPFLNVMNAKLHLTGRHFQILRAFCSDFVQTAAILQVTIGTNAVPIKRMVDKPINNTIECTILY